MTPKEKAEELIKKFMTFGAADFVAKECALICVNELLNENERINKESDFPTPLTEYWQEVKQEIKKL